jgi:DNA (cytosine-5)-methyltransferase 1
MTKKNHVNYSYHELDFHKRNQRVWIEGINIELTGMKKGDRYLKTFDLNNSTLIIKKITQEKANKLINSGVIKKSDLGTVAGRKQKNGWCKLIIDICSASTTELLRGAGKFRADFYKGEIHFSIHHEELKRVEREERTISNIIAGTVKEASAFTGLGVSTLGIHDGLKKTGIRSEVSWVVEKDPKYAKIAVHNNKSITCKTRIIIGSVEEVESNIIDPVDVFSFSMPCDKQSKQGKAKRGHKRVEDEDGATALFGVLNLIKASNPSILVSENVLDAKHSATYKLLIAELERIGYKVYQQDLNQTHSGSIERRERYWFTAVSKGLADGFNYNNFPAQKSRYKSVGDVVDKTDENEERFFVPDYFDKREVENAKNGRNFKKNYVNDGDTSVGVIPRNYLKRQISNPHYAHEKNGTIRLFSCAEHARLKDIPELLIEGEIELHAQEGLGQSVVFGHPLGTGIMIGEHLLSKVA